MLEAIVLAMEESLTSGEPLQDGDLTKYFKRLGKLLNLDPSQTVNGKALPTSLKMIFEWPKQRCSGHRGDSEQNE